MPVANSSSAAPVSRRGAASTATKMAGATLLAPAITRWNARLFGLQGRRSLLPVDRTLCNNTVPV